MRIGMAADHGGFGLKVQLTAAFTRIGWQLRKPADGNPGTIRVRL
jgi:hypothetical protein